MVLQSQGDIDEFLLEDDQGKLLVETATVPAAPDAETSKLILEQDITPFAKGEYIVGSKTGTVAKINVINGDTFYTSTIHGKGFDSGETVTSRQGGQTGVVKSFKHNTILANNNLLNYSDVDKTTEEFLDTMHGHKYLNNFTWGFKNDYDFGDYKFDQIFVCLSPSYIPPLHWHMMSTFIKVYEELSGKKIEIDYLHRKYEMEKYYKGVTKIIY